MQDDRKTQVPEADAPASDIDILVSDVDTPVSVAGTPAPDTDRPVADADAPASDIDILVSDADMLMSAADTQASDIDIPASDTDIPGSAADAPVSDIDIQVSDADTQVTDTDMQVHMEEKKKAEDTLDSRHDFTQGSIFKKLTLFMMPILASLILQAMYGAVDLVIVGHFGSTEGLSGVSTGSNVLNMVTFVVGGLAVGVTVLIGRYLGERRPEKIGPLLGGTIALFGTIAVVLCVLMITLARPIAVLMQSPEEALDLTVQYIRICGAGIIFIIAYNIISGVFRGLGDSNTPLIFVLVACCVNIVLDLVFVAGFHMNVAGAALATVMAQTVSVLLSIVIIKRRKFPFTLRRQDIRFGPEVKRIIRVGFPIALQEFLTQISFMALVAFINRLGLDASSGYGVASKLVNFVMLIPSSIMQSLSSFVSQNVGAGREDRAKKTMLTSMGIGVTVGIFVFFIVYFKGDLISSIFTTDATVIARSWEYLRGIAPEAVVTAILFSFVGYFSGHQQTLYVMLQGIAQTFIVRLPMAYIMSIQPDASLTNIGMAAPTATCFGIVINIIYFIWYNKHLKKQSAAYR